MYGLLFQVLLIIAFFLILIRIYIKKKIAEGDYIKILSGEFKKRQTKYFFKFFFQKIGINWVYHGKTYVSKRNGATISFFMDMKSQNIC